MSKNEDIKILLGLLEEDEKSLEEKIDKILDAKNDLDKGIISCPKEDLETLFLNMLEIKNKFLSLREEVRENV